MVRRGREGRGWPRAPLILLSILVALCLALGSVDDLAQYRIDQLASGHDWSVIDWEARHLPVGLALIWSEAFAPPPEGAVDDRVRAYVMGQQGPGADDEVPLDLALALVVQRQLIEGGVTSLGPVLAPPVALALVEPPRTLVVSPRGEIRLSGWALLDGSLDLAAIEALERSV